MSLTCSHSHSHSHRPDNDVFCAWMRWKAPCTACTWWPAYLSPIVEPVCPALQDGTAGKRESGDHHGNEGYDAYKWKVTQEIRLEGDFWFLTNITNYQSPLNSFPPNHPLAAIPIPLSCITSSLKWLQLLLQSYRFQKSHYHLTTEN